MARVPQISHISVSKHNADYGLIKEDALEMLRAPSEKRPPAYSRTRLQML